MASATAGTSFENDEFDYYTQDELLVLIQEVVKYKRKQFGKESDVDVGSKASGDEEEHNDPDELVTGDSDTMDTSCDRIRDVLECKTDCV